MRLSILTAVAAVLALAGCNQAKPRHTPPDPFAAPPPQASTAEPLSAGLERRGEAAPFTFDHIGAAFAPLTRTPAVTPAGRPTVFDGFGFDPVGKTPAKGIDVVVDGKAYGSAYGAARQDVVRYFKAPWLLDTGFKATLPAAALPPGPHVARVRVISTDGKAYFDGPPVAFQVAAEVR